MKRHARHRRNGNVVVLVALLFPIILGMAAFAVDLGRIGLARSELQAAADAAALAAAEELPNGSNAVNVAQQIGGFNVANSSNIVATGDVEFGTWEANTETFSSTSAADANAVRVTARLSKATGNALPLVFGAMMGTASKGPDAFL